VKRFVTQAVAVGALTLAILLGQVAPGAADGWEHYRHYRHHAHLAYVETVADYGPCRTGWWQTLRYGHVRPVWGSWCR
jgi:hypothetical protein